MADVLPSIVSLTQAKKKKKVNRHYKNKKKIRFEK